MIGMVIRPTGGFPLRNPTQGKSGRDEFSSWKITGVVGWEEESHESLPGDSLPLKEELIQIYGSATLLGPPPLEEAVTAHGGNQYICVFQAILNVYLGRCNEDKFSPQSAVISSDPVEFGSDPGKSTL